MQDSTEKARVLADKELKSRAKEWQDLNASSLILLQKVLQRDYNNETYQMQLEQALTQYSIILEAMHDTLQQLYKAHHLIMIHDPTHTSTIDPPPYLEEIRHVIYAFEDELSLKTTLTSIASLPCTKEHEALLTASWQLQPFAEKFPED